MYLILMTIVPIQTLIINYEQSCPKLLQIATFVPALIFSYYLPSLLPTLLREGCLRWLFLLAGAF